MQGRGNDGAGQSYEPQPDVCGGERKYRIRNTTGLCGADPAVGHGTPQENPTRKSNKQELRREQILEFCVEPKSLSDIMQHSGLKDRKSVMNACISTR